MAGRILREDILRAATTILDRGGLPSLAMRRIAAELDVQQSALYWHFRSKQELLGALADHLLAAVRLPAGDDWAARLTTFSVRLRAALLSHTDGAELVATAYAFGLGAGRLHTAYLEVLGRAGLTGTDADTAASVLLHYVLGSTTSEQQQRQATDLGAIDPRPARRPADADAARRPADAKPSPPPADANELARFRDGLRLIVAGIRTTE